MLSGLKGFERALESRLSQAKTAGESRAALKAIAETAITLICANFRS